MPPSLFFALIPQLPKAVFFRIQGIKNPLLKTPLPVFRQKAFKTQSPPIIAQAVAVHTACGLSFFNGRQMLCLSRKASYMQGLRKRIFRGVQDKTTAVPFYHYRHVSAVQAGAR